MEEVLQANASFAEMLSQQTVGEELYQLRLERAAAVPAAEAAPEVLIFLESNRLLESVYSQLPCNALGYPALPLGADLAEPLLVALYKLAWVSLVSPTAPVHPRNYMGRALMWGTACAPWGSPVEELLAFVRSGQAGSQLTTGRRTRFGRSPAATGVAAQCLHLLGAADYCRLVFQDTEGYMQRHATAIQLLEAPGALDAAAAQLAELRRQNGDLPVLTAQQLLYSCHLTVAQTCNDLVATSVNEALLAQHRQQGSGQAPAAAPMAQALAQNAELLAVAMQSTAALLRLDPDRVKGHMTAGHLAGILQDFEEAKQHFERALELARQQSRKWQVTGAACRLIRILMALPGICNTEAGLAQVQALLAEAEAAWKPCKRLLPERWVQMLAPELERRKQDVRDATARMQRLQEAGTGASPDSRAMLEPSIQERYMEALASGRLGEQTHYPKCDGCGKSAVGLRRCSRCRAASYCSKECQARHWRVHKAACVPRQQ